MILLPIEDEKTTLVEVTDVPFVLHVERLYLIAKVVDLILNSAKRLLFFSCANSTLGIVVEIQVPHELALVGLSELDEVFKAPGLLSTKFVEVKILLFHNLMQQINYNPDRRQYVELFLAGRDLPNVEIFSKSDPQCDIYYTVEGEKEVLLGETEVVYNNLDPNWEKSLTLEYLDDVKQTLRFQIFDFDSKEKKRMIQIHKSSFAW